MTGCWQYGHVPDSFTSQGTDLPAILTRMLAVPVKRLPPYPPATWASCDRRAAEDFGHKHSPRPAVRLEQPAVTDRCRSTAVYSLPDGSPGYPGPHPANIR